MIDITPRQWSEIQAAAAVVGIRAAARQFAQSLPGDEQRACVDRIRQRARRHGWRDSLAQAAKIPAQSSKPGPPLLLVANPARAVANGLRAAPERSAQEAGSVARTAPSSPEPAPALVTGAAMIAAILGKRRERSSLYLSHYLVSATRTLAGTKGDLDQADRAATLARTHAALWPAGSGAGAGAEVAIQLDDQGKVAQIHARLVASLTGRQDERLAGSEP